MEEWKQHIRAGNDCFGNEQLAKAGGHYQLAKARAEQLFPVWFDRHQAVAAVVVSYHNLADLYVVQQSVRAAETELRQVYAFMARAASHAPTEQDLDEALMHGVRRTYTALLNHIREHGTVMGDLPPPFEFQDSKTQYAKSNW